MSTRRHDIPSPGFSDDDSAPASNLSSMQRAIVTIQKLRAKVENLERSRNEPIAIIGMACRFPCDANTPEKFFRMLEEGIDAISEVPGSRWQLDSEQPTDPEARAVRWGAFLEHVDLFDAQFFGISPREASKMDPQQRLLLEVTFEALERAGQVQERLIGSRTGVFLGIMNNDYAELSALAGPQQEDTYTTTGNGHCFPAGRVSYTFGFQGPAVAVDTACSSSLVALHLACQSLRNGECNMAVAGGVNLMLVPSTSRKFAKTQALSPDGRCKSFDATANGFVRGEGCGMIVLKRLSDAERDSDPIIAVIRGSAINQDGRSTGLTAPNVLAQQAMLTQALANARVTAADIGYVETHGTGTPLGDPIEMEALREVLGAPRPSGSHCVLGAVKTNVGHLEAAAGIAGIIKTALILQRGIIPRNNHFRTLNPRIRIESTPFVFPEENLPWTTVMKRRIAGVSSFGMSGTNAHAILEEWPSTAEEDLSPEDSASLLPLSAKNPEALRSVASAYRDYLTNLPADVRLRDVIYTASVRRSHYDHRLSIVGCSREEMVELLDRYLRGETPVGLTQNKSTPSRAKIVFVFSGQGAQWLGMGRELYQTDSSFRSVIDTCDNLMTPRLGWSILDELDATEAMSRMGDTQVAQPLLFALQIALVEMLRSWGISPDAMIGHSVGEIAAAHIAGILSLDEAVRLVALRGRIMQKAAENGKMLSVAMAPEDARLMIAGFENRVSIAAINDPGSVVLSGQASALEEIGARCAKQGVSCRQLRGIYAFHSPLMDAAERELIERLVRVDTRRATLAMYSTVLGECVDGKELDVRYWGRSIRDTVNFEGAVMRAIRDGYQLFLEIGPHPKLVTHIEKCLAAKNSDGFAIGTLRQGRGDTRALLEATGALYTRGCAIEWARAVPGNSRCIPLPTYPWQRERYWLDISENALSTFPKKGSEGRKSATKTTKVVFVFPGQGGQWLGMGQQLLNTRPVFRSALEACDTAIRNEAGFSILTELRADPTTSRLASIDVVQPVLFAIQVALAKLWHTEGVEPDCVVGHSMGEVAAAHVAGMLTLEDAVRVICRRSQLLKRISGKGAMALVELPLAETELAIAGYEATLSIAVSSGPRSTVISGDHEALERVLARLEGDGIYCRRVKVDVASHSPQVDPLRADLLATLHDVHPTPGRIRLISTVTGNPLYGTELGAEYWWHNLRNPVRFSQVIQTLVNDGHTLFVELSPHPILLPAIEEYLHAVRASGAAIASMRRQVDEQQTMLEALGVLYAKGYTGNTQIRSATREPPDPHADCIFEIAWRKKELAAPIQPATSLPSVWLIVRDNRGFGEQLSDKLRSRGDRVVEVVAASHFETKSDDLHFANPTRPEHWDNLLATAFGKLGCRGVVFCCALDSATWQETSETTIATDLRRGPLAALRLTQALLRQRWRDVPRLYVISRAGQAISNSEKPLCAAQSTLWGLGRVIATEQPDLGCVRIDLPHDICADEIDWVARELESGSDEDQVAFRSNGRHVARLVRGHWSADKAITQQVRINGNGTYLIVGGLGGLGLSLAKWLAQQGAKSLVLVGRSAPSEETSTAIAEIQAMGTIVRVVQADVSDRAAVDALFAQIDLEAPPLRGVVHAAAVLNDRTIAEMSEEEFFRPIGAKVFGGWNLHQATLGRTLDFFVVYSSVAGLLGNPGQANYAASNAFVDGLCHARAAEGLPAMSIQWGAFADVGLAAASDVRGKRLASRGTDSFKPEEGNALFARLLGQQRTEVSLMRFDVRKWMQFHPQTAGSAFLSEIEQERSDNATAFTDRSKFRNILEQASTKERIAFLEMHLAEQLGLVLRLDPGQIDKHTPFTNLGMDSLMSLELRNRLEASLGLRLSAALLFTYSTTATLANHLIAQMFAVSNNEATLPETNAMAEIESINDGKQPMQKDDAALVGKLEAFEEYLT